MNLLALVALTAVVAASPVPKAGAAGIPCNRGCNSQNGQCWVLLATFEENVAGVGESPLWVTEKRYVGEPYPAPADAMCGAIYVKGHGVCIANAAVVDPSKVEIVLSDGSEPSYPGESDCYYY